MCFIRAGCTRCLWGNRSINHGWVTYWNQQRAGCRDITPANLSRLITNTSSRTILLFTILLHCLIDGHDSRPVWCVRVCEVGVLSCSVRTGSQVLDPSADTKWRTGLTVYLQNDKGLWGVEAGSSSNHASVQKLANICDRGEGKFRQSPKRHKEKYHQDVGRWVKHNKQDKGKLWLCLNVLPTTYSRCLYCIMPTK